MDGNDLVRGGLGIDTYDASAATGPVFINLDTVAHDFGPLAPGVGLVAANTAAGTDVAGNGNDAIFGFENVNCGASLDVIYGSAAGNTLNGGDNNDILFGFGGNDKLNGDAGSDDLIGGAGKDQLTGGAGSDFFHYLKLSDSGITAATRDLIADFESGVDKIDLSFIDANTLQTGDQAFNFIGPNVPFQLGTQFAGQLNAFWSAIGQIIQGDVNGDAKPDFSIEIADPAHAITLTGASFNL